MVHPFTLMSGYLALMFALAYFAERRREMGRSLTKNPIVYALSLMVFLSGWTLFGLVEGVIVFGLGPAWAVWVLTYNLIPVFFWLILRRVIIISKQEGITSVSDFVSARYGRTVGIGALVAVLATLFITPYIGLQMLALSSAIIAFGEDPQTANLIVFFVAILLGFFAIFLGARTLDPSERHEGLVFILAFDAIFKLIAILAVGVFVTFFVFDGFGEIFSQVAVNEQFSNLLVIEEPIKLGYPLMFSSSMVFIFFSVFGPRMFHMGVVENTDVDFVKPAMIVITAYLFLTILFIPSIAFGGLLLGLETPKEFVITIPLEEGVSSLAFLAFLGGFSATSFMVVASLIALSTMLLNSAIAPQVLKIKGLKNIHMVLLNIKRVVIMLLILFAYTYALALGLGFRLTGLGIGSFVGIAQFAPAILGGLYWRDATRQGAITGLVAGALMWTYTTVVPAFAQAGVISSQIVIEGPAGIGALRPTALLGLTGLDPVSHGLFWSLLINSGLFILISLASEPTSEELRMADVYVGREIKELEAVPTIYGRSLEQIESSVSRFIGPDRTREVVDNYIRRIGKTRDTLTESDLINLRDRLNRVITAALGSPAAREIIERGLLVPPVEVRIGPPTVPRYELPVGRFYLIKDREIGYKIMSDIATYGLQGIVITSRRSAEVREGYNLGAMPIIRVSEEHEPQELGVGPEDLETLQLAISSFISVSENSTIYIDNIDDIIKNNEDDLNRLLDFVNGVGSLLESALTRVIVYVPDDLFIPHLDVDIYMTRNLHFAVHPLEIYFLEHTINTIIPPKATPAVIQRYLFEAQSTSKALRNAKYEAGAIKINRDLVLLRSTIVEAVREFIKVIVKRELLEMAAQAGDILHISPYELLTAPGRIYLIEEDSGRILSIFAEMTRGNMCGLAISRRTQGSITKEYSPEKIAPLIWLTQTPCEIKPPDILAVPATNECKESIKRTMIQSGCMDPTNIPRLSGMIERFIEETENSVIVLEGLGYLISQNDFPTILRFIQSLGDKIMVSNSRLILSIDPLTLDTREIHLLRSETSSIK